jgi:hypothetical protein
VLNIVVLSALAALHTLVMVWVFDPTRNISVLAQMLLAGMITLVMLLVARPVRRMWQMTELAVGAVGGALPAAPPGVLARLRRRRPGTEATASERFWEEASGSGADTEVTGSVSGNVVRPEAGAPVIVAAQRWQHRDNPPAAIPLPGPAGSSSPSAGGAALAGSGASGARPDRLAALPPGFTVTARARTGEEPVYVPSAVGEVRGAPRPADMEEVAGRPVWVVYRPSAGLELGADREDSANGSRTTD